VNNQQSLLNTLLVLPLLLNACSSSDATSADSSFEGASPGVAQGGAQDFGAFREVVDRGELPAPELLDDIGFFNEHKIELPEARCEHAVCLHAELGVMGNLVNGSNCTMLFLGLNTPLNPENFERPPLDLALALDTSGSMSGAAIENLRIGLELMLPKLRPEDRVTLVTFSDETKVWVADAPADSETLRSAVLSLEAVGSTDIYAGLSEAYGELEEPQDPTRERRVVLLSDGEATAGFLSPKRLTNLVSAYAADGISLSVIGVGEAFDASLLRDLATTASGSFYFLDSPLALRDVFVEEIQSALLPLARDARITVTVGEGYRLRGVYGALEPELSEQEASIDLAVLQLAHRSSALDNESGRRGGGGAIVVELTPEGKQSRVDEIPNADHPVGSVEFSYLPQAVLGAEAGDERVVQTVPIRSPLLPGETPRRGYFPTASVEKSFVMVNLFASMRSALEDVEFGDSASALATLSALDAAVSAWLEETPDSDIAEDLEYLRRLSAVIQSVAPPLSSDWPEAPSPWPQD
jgi:Ca-activated chloride channel homolog